MKLIIAFWLIAAAAAAPPLMIISDDKASEAVLPIYESKVDADGNYSFSNTFPLVVTQSGEWLTFTVNLDSRIDLVFYNIIHEFTCLRYKGSDLKFAFTSPDLVVVESPQINMKLIVALCLIAMVAAAPPRVSYPQDNVNLLRYENDADSDGSYKFGFEQTDGQKRDETGEVRNAGTDNESLVVKGSYRWIGPDGVEYLVTYVANEDGYQPEIQQGPGGAVSPQLASLLG